MVKKVEGGFYRRVGGNAYFDSGTILILKHDDGSNYPLFTDGNQSFYLSMRHDVKVIHPNAVGESVKLYRTKHTNKDKHNLGYHPEFGMLQVGESGVVTAVCGIRGVNVMKVKCDKNGAEAWYYRKDLISVKGGKRYAS